MNLFKRRKEEISYTQQQIPTPAVQKEFDTNEDLLFQCKDCGHTVPHSEFENSGYVCQQCKVYHSVNARQRIAMLVDAGTFQEMNETLTSKDPLKFPTYKEKVREVQAKTDLTEAVITGTGNLGGMTVAIGVMDTRFFMGSMGTVVGEKITNLIEHATLKKLPLIMCCASGGARMQEGILSLMQMAKTSAAIKRHSNEGLLYISILTHPTLGGVSASFATLADIILAEPNALIGFAGPRVIEQTINETLPEGFQRSEAVLKQGFIDRIVKRAYLKNTLMYFLKLHGIRGAKS